MPASYVHQSIAEDARAACLPLDHACRAAFLAGSLGPDPLFFSVLPGRGLLRAPRTAIMIHTQRTDEFLLELMKFCRGNPVCEAYLLGFLTHYAADSICHPYIYARSYTENGAYSTRMHLQLERQLDLLVKGMREECTPASSFSPRLTPADASLIAPALCSAIREVFPSAGLPPVRIRICLLCAALFGLRSPQPGTGSVSLQPPPHLPPDSPLNPLHQPWFSPWAPHIERRESFPELYDQAVSRAASLIRAARRYFSGGVSYAHMRALLGGLSYCSGLPWSGTCHAAKTPDLHRRFA